MEQGFKIIVSSDKYRSEITTQLRNNNLDYMIHPSIRNINKVFILSFKNGGNDPTIYIFGKYYMQLAEIEDFSVLIGIKSFFHQPLKNKQEAFENLLKCQKTIIQKENSLDWSSHQN